MDKLYRFSWNCGRMGKVEGLFIADENEIKKEIGSEVYFGEILGKHSEVYGTLDKEDLKVESEDESFVSKMKSLLGSTISGYNPLEYINK